MAIYHNSTKIISRSSGRSSVGSSAYRSGEKITNEYDGTTHDYSRKTGIVYSEIMLPSQAKEEFKNRSVLWNEVEKVEKSKNSQLAREVEVALPNELSREEQIILVKSYIQDNFIKNGMCADLNIHDKEDGNPHAHIMLTMRPIEQNGEWGTKSKKEYLLDQNGQKIKLKSGQYKSKKIETTNWNTKEFLESYRKDWADKINEKLREKGINQTVDHRSYEEQGIEKIPTIHEGATARKIEAKGKISDRMDINRQIKAINEKIEQCNLQIHKLKNETLELNKSIAPSEEITSIRNNIMQIKEYREQLADATRKLDDIKRNKELLLRNDLENREAIERLKQSIVKVQNKRKSLGLFDRAEKRNCDDRIGKYFTRIEELKEKLLSVDDIKELKDEVNVIDRKLIMAKEKLSDKDKRLSELHKKEIEYKLKQDRENSHRAENKHNILRKHSFDLER